MGGGTGNIRTYRISASNGYRTIGSMLANGSSGAGAGSTRRIYAYYQRNGLTVGNGFYAQVLGVNFGQFRDRAQWFISNTV
jgi:hypothetical protein